MSLKNHQTLKNNSKVQHARFGLRKDRSELKAKFHKIIMSPVKGQDEENCHKKPCSMNYG
jgi:hypothetical protein